MSERDDYRRTTTTNLPDDHETKKVCAIRLPRNEKMIYLVMVIFLIALATAAVAIQNGWLK
jgi:cell division protein FtsL